MSIKRLGLSIVLGLAGLFFALPAGATVMGVFPGDLIKLQNDHDPATHEDEVVYYFDKEWFRHPFPNRKVFLSWYRDFSGVKELTREELADIRLAGNIVYRPGTRLVKIPSVPKVYAVEPNGVLRWIESEAAAVALYGADWSKRVDDVPESFFVNYAEGAPLVAPAWPTGSIVRRASDATLFYIDGPFKRHLAAGLAESYRLDESSVISSAGDLGGYGDGTDVNPAERRYVDTAQLDYVDTLPPPQFDLPFGASIQTEAGAGRKLLTLRVTAGQPVIVRKLRVGLSGPLWSGSVPNLTGLRFADAAGENVFGTKQLENSGASGETLEWNGALTLNANSQAVIDLLADVAAPAGSTLTLTIDPAGLGVAHGGNGQDLPAYYSRTVLSPVQVEIK